ncbi:hypothetical protein PRIPAC_81944 [Pristionchus pacificus]|uniref:G protein-coupled receptor n=1 Tax=Pristionchus pacificus TaxID=54126 RepID=A0A2A6CQ22_PRIPA|nr:hypothetical protein PRIPAC_81944 [Pristionchus pacificus]|eukprot:PDM80143.1 G protein-coupled receptor [Pristionchus pacificus]
MPSDSMRRKGFEESEYRSERYNLVVALTIAWQPQRSDEKNSQKYDGRADHGYEEMMSEKDRQLFDAFAVVEIANIVLAFIINFFLLWAVVRKSKDLGGYRYLLLAFTINDIYFPLVHALTLPIICSYGNVFLMFSHGLLNSKVSRSASSPPRTRKRFAHNGESVFIYRLVALRWPHLLRFYTARNSTLLVLSSVIFQQNLWFWNCWFSYDSDQELQAYVKPFLEREFPGEGTGHIGALYYNEKGLRISAVLATMGFDAIMTFWITLILSCSVMIARLFSTTGNARSNKTERLQRQLFRTLVVQMVIPLFCVYLPCAFIINLPMFFQISVFPNLVPASLTFIPVIDALITIFGVKNYRNFFLTSVLRRRVGMLRLIASSMLIALSSASFCGDSTVPFSLEPLLGCARPTCFGWAPDGKRATNTAYFERVNGSPDGYVRIGRDSIPPYGHEDARYFLPQTSLRCCAFEALFESEDRGVATLHAGQISVGGEIINSGIQAGFDYISDIDKLVQFDGSVQYLVSLRRMRCPGIKEKHSAASHYSAGGNAQAFQAPNVAVNQPLPLPPSSASSAVNSLVEQASQAAQERGFNIPPNEFSNQQQFSSPEHSLQASQAAQERGVNIPPNEFANQQQFGNQQQPYSQYGPQQQQYRSGLQPPSSQYQTAQGQPQGSSCQAHANPMYYSAVSFGCGGQFCFSGDMTVEVVDGTTKRMDQLTKTDWVLSLSNKELVYEPVEFWLHRVPSQEAEFNVFETEDGKTIKLTDKHYIFKGDCSRLNDGAVNASTLPQEAVTADQVRAGDCLYTMWTIDRQMHEVRVVRASKVTETGIYAPMTNSGRIIVNGVHASCHNIMQEHTTGHALFQYVTMFNQWYEAIFGADPDQVVETPNGLSTILAVADLIIPKSIGVM